MTAQFARGEIITIGGSARASLPIARLIFECASLRLDPLELTGVWKSLIIFLYEIMVLISYSQHIIIRGKLNIFICNKMFTIHLYLWDLSLSLHGFFSPNTSITNQCIVELNTWICPFRLRLFSLGEELLMSTWHWFFHRSWVSRLAGFIRSFGDAYVRNYSITFPCLSVLGDPLPSLFVRNVWIKA